MESVGAMIEARVTEAVSLSVDDRHDIIGDFFCAYPGVGGEPPGLGRALIDFVGWMTSSGRLDDTAGSPWWKALNGFLILDLAAVLYGAEDSSGPDGAGAWHTYVAGASDPGTGGGRRQTLLWEAHQVSLHSAIPLSWSLFEREPSHERDFIETAMEIVDLAAIKSQQTDSDVLAESTRRLYPRYYPLTAPYGDDLARVRAASLREHKGSRVGLHSELWNGRGRQAS